MRVRQPRFDFSQTPAHWTAIPEFAHSMNSTSIEIPQLERFLNRVMAKARAEIVGDDPQSKALRADITTFIKQESCHYTSHGEFNEVLLRSGYDRLHEFQAESKAFYDNLLETKSLAFLCAYCEGFETIGPPSALAWLDEMEDMLVGADPNAVALWKWHLLEEYEHRTVAYDVFKRIHGGYFLRIYGFFYQLAHLVRQSGRVQAYLLEVDRKTMAPEQIKQSKRNAKMVKMVSLKRIFLRVIKAMSPLYTPRRSPEPRNFRGYMQTVESKLA